MMSLRSASRLKLAATRISLFSTQNNKPPEDPITEERIAEARASIAQKLKEISKQPLPDDKQETGNPFS